MSGIIVHEWIEKFGGAEQVVDAMMDLYPDADMYCAWNDAPERYKGRRVVESVISRTPLRGKKALALPIMQATWRGMRSKAKYDWMLISSHAFAHHATFTGNNRYIPRLAYVHTPARYIWLPELDERGDSFFVRLVSQFLRPIDRRRAGELTAIAANSEFVKKRIMNTWGREATVIYPPVAVEEIGASTDAELTESELQELRGLPDQFLLGVSRFVSYKKLDMALRTGAITGMPVVLAGGGPELENLRKLGRELKVNVRFIMHPSTEMLRALYRATSLLVFPAIEDFGIVPVEAIAAGTPVLVSDVGGTTESIQDGVNGAHIHDWSDHQSIREAVAKVLTLDRDAVKDSAKHFSTQRFQNELDAWISESLQDIQAANGDK